MNQGELIVRRRIVRAFISAEAISIQLIRRGTRTRTGAGGWTTLPSLPRPPQMVRIVAAKRRFDNGLVNTEFGELPKTEYLLLGSYSLDIEVDDLFNWQGNQYKISGILPNREERTLCSMTYNGPPNG